ncbi:MAG TPA: aldose epimerase family protein [Rhizomicrobium sp.]|jgi:aldose 1-epimerase|nr:aldose epimerase family protein [Rhizomicrobium sp.]
MFGRSILVTAFLALIAAAPVRAANITAADWGTTARGEKVQLFTLKGAGGLEADISNFGGVIVKLMVPDKSGKKIDVMLGYDDFASYEKGGVYGAIIGRYVGRISHGGSFPLGGKTYQLEKPSPDAKSVIHGGTAGFQKKVWAAVMHDGAEPSLTLTVVSPDGDGGFPGALTASVTYTVTRDNGLKLEYRATSDRPTIANLSNHAYFALQGEGNGDVSNQTLQVFASKFLPQDADILVTGEIASVDGTPFDFRKPVRIGDVLHSPFPQIAMRGGLDICMIVDGPPGTLRRAARLSDPGTGIVMDVSTTQPGVQLYSDGIGDRTAIGKGGKTYRTYYSMSLETQHYLDAPNQPGFPPAMVTPSGPLHETTLFRFSTQ